MVAAPAEFVPEATAIEVAANAPEKTASAPDDLAKYYSERAKARPAMTFARPVEAVPVLVPVKKAPVKAAPRKPAPPPKPLSEELAAAVAVVLGGATEGAPGLTTTPFTLLEREAVSRVERRIQRIKFAKIGAWALLGAFILHFAITRVFYRTPTDDALQAYGQKMAGTVVPYYSSLLQPFQVDGTVVALNEAVDSKHLRYAVEVTLRLRESLYKPAFTNGTASYRQLQESLQSARAQELKFKLLEGKEGPEAPALPLLIQVSHRAGDTLVVRVPFEARRFGWAWRLGAPLLASRSTNRRIEGDALQRFASSPYLVYESSGTLSEIRRRSALARNYIIAVTKEVQKRSNVQAVADGPILAAQSAPIARPPILPSVAGEVALPAAATQAAIDPNASLAGFDPDAPAIVVPGLTPKEFDPNAPAIELPAAAGAQPPVVAAAPAAGLAITVPGLVDRRRVESAMPKR
ncbi:MAG TPA: hypothetical protein VM029_11150 [Opitutaceae bacterium]|nr:hypothetical protein [Opitutaceae bacterium]